ncbi:MAG: DUF2993 domain-containing protein [Prochlorotrichaceae cyanobacterium]
MKTDLIRRLLKPAIKLWLRSQVEASHQIEFEIESSDRELLSGKINQIFVSGEEIVYQGLHLSAVQLNTQDIQFNLGQIVRGKSFRLLHPLQAAGTLFLRETDLNASIASPLLGNVLEELLDQWAAPLKTLPHWTEMGTDHHWREIEIAFKTDTLNLKANFHSAHTDTIPLHLTATVQVSTPQTIVLNNLIWDCPDPQFQHALATTTELTIALGSEAAIDTLTLEPGQVTCQMHIVISP